MTTPRKTFTVFTEGDFTGYADVKITAKDKAKFANHFVRFAKSGFTRELFPKWFYNRLSMCFGNIAHFNQDTFYHTCFSNNYSIAKFLRKLDEYSCHGDARYTYCDVEFKLQPFVHRLREKYQIAVADDIEQRERAEYKRLKNKFEPD